MPIKNSAELAELDISPVALSPYNVTSDIAPYKVLNSADIARMAKLDPKWINNVATEEALGVNRYRTPYLRRVGEFIESTAAGAVDFIAQAPAKITTYAAGAALAEPISTPQMPEGTFLNQALGEVLSGREYPLKKYARRILANAMNNIETRNELTELINQTRNIDSSEWQNEFGRVLGESLPLMFMTGGAASLGKLAGLSRAEKIGAGLAGGVATSAPTMAGEYAAETARAYIERTGDKNFEDFTASDAKTLSATAYGAIGTAIEFAGGVEPIMAGALKRVGLRGGPKALLKIAAGEASEEFAQGMLEQFLRELDGTKTQTWGDAFQDSLKGAVYGALIGGTVGTTAFYVNRNNLVKGLKKAFPGREETTLKQIADEMIDLSAEASTQDNRLRQQLRDKVAYMYEGSDITDIEDIIDATTDLEYSLIVADARERGLDIAEHPLFLGEVNELGWFREGIPAQRRAEIQEYIKEIQDLKTQLKKLTETESKAAKIDEIESKLEQARALIPERLSGLVRADQAEIARMLAEQRMELARRQALKNLEQRARKAAIGQTLRGITREMKVNKALNERLEDSIENIYYQPFAGSRVDYDQPSLEAIGSGEGRQAHGWGLYYALNPEIADEVEIPENTDLIEEQKVFTSQPKSVKKALRKLFADKNINFNELIRTGYVNGNPTGRQLYGEVMAVSEGSDKAASKLLREYGIKGITYDGGQDGRAFVIFDANDIEVIQKKFDKLGNALWQRGPRGKSYRGAYIPEYRIIAKTQNMDASTLSHELAHDWIQENFRRYRSGKASKDFMKSWGAAEKALGIKDSDIRVPKKASEAFARAYEGWILNKKDWDKNLSVEDKDKERLIKEFKAYQQNLREIYENLVNPYFKEAWGKTAELKPELESWFERVAQVNNLEAQVKRGEITETEAVKEQLDTAIDRAIENTTDKAVKADLQAAKTLNDTTRYEVKGGNKNAIQQRLGRLAREIDENTLALNQNYDTHRDMMAVAEAADSFVKTRQQDALDIINGIRAEEEGLFASDLYTALERVAIENSDLNLLYELKSSKIAKQLAKELGQRVAGFRNWKSDGLDVVSTLKSLDAKFDRVTETAKGKEKIEIAMNALQEVQQVQDVKDMKQLDSLLSDMECK